MLRIGNFHAPPEDAMSLDSFTVKPGDDARKSDHKDSPEFAGFTEIPFYVRSTQVLVTHSAYAHSDDPPCGTGPEHSHCETLYVYIPAGSTVVAVNLYCKEEHASDWIPCRPYERPLGWSRFDQPFEDTTPGNRVVAVQFKNWSGDRARWARMDVSWR